MNKNTSNSSHLRSGDNRKIFRGIAAFLLLFLASGIHAQDNFGFDLNVVTEKDFTKRFSGELNVGSRFMYEENQWFTERVSFGAGLGYKIVDTKKFDLKLSAGFEYIAQHKLRELEYTKKENLKVTESRTLKRTRTSLGLGGAFKPNKRWTFSLKETVQYNHYAPYRAEVLKFDRKMKDGEYYYNYDENATWYDNYEDCDDSEMKDFKAKDRFVLRSKLTIKYDIKHSIFSPYASCDYGCGLNYSTNKWKITAGTEIKFTKKHNMDVFYRYQTEDDDDEPNGHLIGVGYILKF